MACSLANKYGTNEIVSAMIMAYLHKFNRDLVKPPLGEAELERHIVSDISFVRSHPLFTSDSSSLKGEAPKRADGISRRAIDVRSSQFQDDDKGFLHSLAINLNHKAMQLI